MVDILWKACFSWMISRQRGYKFMILAERRRETTSRCFTNQIKSNSIQASIKDQQSFGKWKKCAWIFLLTIQKQSIIFIFLLDSRAIFLQNKFTVRIGHNQETVENKHFLWINQRISFPDCLKTGQ